MRGSRKPTQFTELHLELENAYRATRSARQARQLEKAKSGLLDKRLTSERTGTRVRTPKALQRELTHEERQRRLERQEFWRERE